MPQIRKIVMFGSTFAVALGIGFVMQNGDALAARFATDDELRAAQAQVMSRSGINDFIVLDALPRAEAEPEMPEPTVAEAEPSPEDGPVLPELDLPAVAAAMIEFPVFEAIPALALPVHFAAAEASEPDVATDAGPGRDVASANTAPAPTDCAPAVQARTTDAAMVALSVSAPCNIDSRGTLHHHGMMFTFLTDEEGTAELVVPALVETAVFIAEIAGGESALTMIEVPDVALYDRAVLQWQGEAGLELHAREFGAGYGEAGHVWQAAARGAASGDAGSAGFLVRLGDAAAEQALMADVYTFPRGMAAQEGTVVLTAEIEITAANCGRDIAAQSLQIGADSERTALDLTLTLPGCDATGDFLVLQNMFEDLTLAAR